ncbi:MAG: hypothetical protein KGH93_02060 [Patescibacteria group bacterium]|nr:hypothetical protein [Patescibacteria group bacterium]MDE1945963.1 hypothetical protein [Patescibacteria group bacterium]
MKKYSIIAMVLVIIIATALLLIRGNALSSSSLSAAKPVKRDPFILITANDLTNAGFSGVSAQAADGKNYQLPVQYFWVSGASEKRTMPDGNFDLVAVSQYTDNAPYTDTLFPYGTSTRLVGVSGARAAQESAVSAGRIALDFSKGDYYFVVIGPNAADVLSLANIIAAKI